MNGITLLGRPILIAGNPAVRLLDESVFPKEKLELAIGRLDLGDIRTLPRELYNKVLEIHHKAYQEFVEKFKRYFQQQNVRSTDKYSKIDIGYLLILMWHADALKDEIIFLLDPTNIPNVIRKDEIMKYNKKGIRVHEIKVINQKQAPPGLLVVGEKKTLPAVIGQEMEVPHRSYRGIHYGRTREEIWIRVRNLPYHKDPALLLVPYIIDNEYSNEEYRPFLIYGDTINGLASVGKVLRNFNGIKTVAFWDKA